MAEKPDEFVKAELEGQLKGKTMEVYLHFLRKRGSVGVRELQRELHLSSPSVAVYHIEKLARLGIVEKDQYGQYSIARKVDVGVLNAFITVGRFSLPRLGFYAAFFTTVAFAYLYRGSSSLDTYALVGTAGGAIAFWYEAWRIWRRKPF